MSNSGKFSEHISNVHSSIKNMSGWILRTFKSRSKDVLLTNWKVMILPLHDYCSPLWSPHKSGDIMNLELLQWFFLKKIKSNFPISDYWDALDYYSMYSHQRRRERYQIIYVWKIIENIVPNPVISSEFSSRNFINVVMSSRLGRKCVVPSTPSRATTAIKNIRFNSFHVHGCRLFNALPASIRNITGLSVEQFKHSLDVFLYSVPDRPRLPGLRKFCPANSNSLIDIIQLPS